MDSGQIISGTYRLVTPLGAGGMGEVWRAEQIGFGRYVALKMLSPALAADHDQRTRFLREGRTCARLKHPNIVRILDNGEDQGQAYLVMELIDGPPLDELMARNGQTLSYERSCLLAARVADALGAAHAAGIVHRDLKPANVLVAANDRVVVTDWGLARTIDGSDAVTKTGLLLGTPHYLAPEAINSGESGPAADLYALGVMLFFMTTGTLPFDDENMTNILIAHLRRRPPRLRKLHPSVPASLEVLVLDLMQKDPAKRPRRADDVANALRQIAAKPSTGLGAHQHLPAIHDQSGYHSALLEARPGRLKLATMVLVLLALASVGLGLAYVLTNTPGFSQPPAAPVVFQTAEVLSLIEAELRVKGRRTRPITLHFPGTARKTMSYDPTEGEQLSQTVTRFIIPLDPPLRRKTTLVARHGSQEPARLELDPEPVIDELLEPIERLAGPRLEQLKQQLDLLAANAIYAKQRSDLATIERLQGDVDALLTQYAVPDSTGVNALPLLLTPPLRLDTDLARRLLPLRVLDSVFAAYTGLTAPWGRGLEGLAVEYWLLDPSVIKVDDDTLPIASRGRTLLGKTDLRRERTIGDERLFLGDALATGTMKTAERVGAGILDHTQFSASKRMSLFTRPDAVTTARWQITLFPQRETTWPLPRAWLALHLTEWGRRASLDLSINGQQSFKVLLRTAADCRTSPIMVIIEIDPTTLHRTTNEIVASLDPLSEKSEERLQIQGLAILGPPLPAATLPIGSPRPAATLPTEQPSTHAARPSAAVSGPSAPASPPAPPILAHWTFDGGDSRDSSPNKRHGTNNSVDFKASETGFAASFVTTDSIITVPNEPPLDLSQGLTVAARFRCAHRKKLQTIVGQWYYPDCFLLHTFDELIHFSVVLADTNAANQTVSAPFQAERWQVAIGTYRPGLLRLYLDDDLVAERTTPKRPIRPSSRPITIGSWPTWNSFRGEIDEIYLLGRACSMDDLPLRPQLTASVALRNPWVVFR